MACHSPTVSQRAQDDLQITAVEGHHTPFRHHHIAGLEHKRVGNPVAAMKDGKVVIIQPEDIEMPEE